MAVVISTAVRRPGREQLKAKSAADKRLGIVMDYLQRPQFDFGLTGPEKGGAGKALIIGPGQNPPDDAAGYHVIRMPTRFAFIGYRVLDRGEKDKITPLNKIYPYSERANRPGPNPTRLELANSHHQREGRPQRPFGVRFVRIRIAEVDYPATSPRDLYRLCR
jgi:hypothetical protein